MRLIGYGPGEILDRLSILALKRAHHDLPHFATEQQALLAVYRRGARPKNGLIEILELGAINSRLWQLEDELRALRKTQGWANSGRIVAVAMEIQECNDRRAVLVREINRLAGVPAPQEKL